MTTSYRRFMPPPVATGGTAAASGFSTIMVTYQHNKENRRQQATLDTCEDEGGYVPDTIVAAAPNVVPGGDATMSEPLPIGLVPGAAYCPCRDAILES